MKKTLISILIISVVVVGYSKYRTYKLEESLYGSPKESSWLPGGFRSYESLSGVKKRLIADKYQWNVIDSTNDKYLGYRFSLLEIAGKDFKIGDFKGDLLLGFFNNRLYGVDFVTDDYEAYEKILKSEKKVVLTSSKEATVYPRTKIFFKKKADSEFSKAAITSYDDKLTNDADYWGNKGEGQGILGP